MTYQEYIDSLMSLDNPDPNGGGTTTPDPGDPGQPGGGGTGQPAPPPGGGTTTAKPPFTPGGPDDPAMKALYGNKAAFKEIFLKSGGKTVADLKKFVDEGWGKTFGVKIGGSKGDKIYGPDGTFWIDAVRAAGGPNGGDGFYWGEGEGGGGNSAGGDFTIDPTYLSPFEEQFQGPGAGPDVPDFPEFQYADFEGFDPFTAPTAESILHDPSYQFRRDQGAGAIENSAAARGLLNSGGTLKDLLGYGQQFASQEYGNIWDRDFNLWGTQNQNKLTGYETNRNNAANNFATNYGLTRDRYDLLNQANKTSYDRLWNEYLNRKDTWYRNQNEPFSKQLDLLKIGFGGASA